MKWRNQRSNRSPSEDHADSCDMWLVNLLGHIIPEQAREEWLGDLKEARLDLLLHGWSNGAVMLITIIRACLLVWSLLRIKYEDLGLGNNRGRLEPENLPNIAELIRSIAMSKSIVFIVHEQANVRMSMAQTIHSQGRRNGPFVVFDCGATPQDLIDRKLFGEISDGPSLRVGCFQRAIDGTLFLDRIHELPLALQAKLLMAVCERSFTPVGGSSPIEFDTRIIVASNRNMRHELEQGRFRADLYYHLNVIPLVGGPQGSFLRLADSLQ